MQRRKPKGIVDQVLMRRDMMIRAQLQELDMRLDREISMGLISPDEADMIMLNELQKMGLIPRDFGAENWDDVDWSGPPGDVVRRDDFEWDGIDWDGIDGNSEDYQAAKAFDYLMGLAEGSATTELESRFILSPRHFRQFIARVGSDRFGFIENIEGFGEGPYPVALDILTPDEVITQTELQLHTIFEAFETVLEGAPNEDDHDHDHDDEDHDHDEFETILMYYLPYQPAVYRVHVRTSEGVKMMGEYDNLVAAQELADDWNAPGYGRPIARIEQRPHRNGAFSGVSRVMFEDDSYLTFNLLGDLIHRDGEFVDMTSLFVFPRAFSPDADYWETIK